MIATAIEQLNQMARDRGRPFKALIIDDEKWVAEVFKDFCETTEAIEVEVASGGAEGIEMAQSQPFDIITVDIIMPEMSGLDILGEIRRAAPRTPIWVITGNATEKLIREAGVLGASQVIYKPVELDRFVAELAAVLARGSKS